jgi:pSer/pThr/pTyr-binding forkhead associated (FHA) protein
MMSDEPETVRAPAPGRVLETGWVLSGRDGADRPVRLVFGDTELSQVYLGMVIGRHPALCDRVIDDPSVSRRHLRIGMAEGKPYVEDLNSLNGTLLDGAEVPQFEPVPLVAGQELTLGRVVLEVARSEGP